MPKPKTRPYSRATKLTASLLGSMIREARINAKMSTAELAERVGVSRSLLYRIEQGELTTAIGVVFEAAYIVGIPLFSENNTTIARETRIIDDRLRLLPQSIRKATVEIDDDF